MKLDFQLCELPSSINVNNYQSKLHADAITVQKTGYTLSDILRIFRVYASRIPLAE